MAVRDDADVVARCRSLAEELRAVGLRVHLDDKVEVSAGRRATDWELKGVPVRLELGPRDLADEVVTLVDRISADGAKVAVALAGIAESTKAVLEAAQRSLFDAATARLRAATVDVATLEEAREASLTGFARVPWSVVGTDGEAQLATSAVTIRCLVRPDGTLPQSDDEPDLLAVTARSY
jgi:prolyl-tRNA synthetase